MPAPYYVSPEQIMQEKEDFARKGIEKAKEVIVLEYQHGLVMVAENPLATVFKISEIYDRLAIAATGLYPDYEALRVAGIQAAEVKGLTFNREDVTAKWLANQYSQQIGAIYRQPDAKPLEIELLLCEIREDSSSSHRTYHLSFDGTFWEENEYAVIGGRADEITGILDNEYTDGLDLNGAVKFAAKTFETIEAEVDEDDRYEIAADTIEVAILDETRNRRKFRRLPSDEVREILSA
ncbi:MAG: proteasome subunit alpha [Candidatus Poribacteria bacterium]|nr:proteasome subunit alpha [Candidatus Poribacteria bacterium]